jgi:hypothetical protein
MTQPKPEGYTSISPCPIVDGAGRTIDFLVRGLDAAEIRTHRRAVA